MLSPLCGVHKESCPGLSGAKGSGLTWVMCSAGGGGGLQGGGRLPAAGGRHPPHEHRQGVPSGRSGRAITHTCSRQSPLPHLPSALPGPPPMPMPMCLLLSCVSSCCSWSCLLALFCSSSLVMSYAFVGTQPNCCASSVLGNGGLPNGRRVLPHNAGYRCLLNLGISGLVSLHCRHCGQGVFFSMLCIMYTWNDQPFHEKHQKIKRSINPVASDTLLLSTWYQGLKGCSVRKMHAHKKDQGSPLRSRWCHACVCAGG